MVSTVRANPTPGPWRVGGGSMKPHLERLVIRGSGGEYLARVDYGKDRETVDANARLMAAAPELLAALYGLGEQVVASHNGWCFDSCADNGLADHSPACAAARAAIAKAEGR